MATEHFQPEGFDTDWRLVIHWIDEASGTTRAEVSCFEFYGPALEAWRQVDREQLDGVGRSLTGWELIDPSGIELLTRESRLSVSDLGQVEPGRYVWNEQREAFEAL